MAEKYLRLTLTKSIHGRLKKHRLCAKGLGLRGVNSSVVVSDTPQNRGMINKISYMLQVEDNA